MKVTNSEKAIFCKSDSGPTFSNSTRDKSDAFYISNNSNINTLSYSHLGDNYKHPKYQYGSDEAKTFLAGSNQFQVSEIEVYTK